MNIGVLVGKQVASVVYADPWGEGLTMHFNDGTSLHINEAMQAGELAVFVDGRGVESDWHTKGE
jgi:hypothetical protein